MSKTVKNKGGTIFERKLADGSSSFMLKYDAGGVDAKGKRRLRYATVRGTLKEAQAELRRLLKQVDDNVDVDPLNITVGQWVEQWLETLEQNERVSVRTHEGYARWLRLHVVPALGKEKLQKLTGAQIQAFYNNLRKSGHKGSVKKEDEGQIRGLSHQSVLHTHRTVFQLLKAATKLRLVQRNVAEDVETPRPDKARERATYGEDEAVAVKVFTPTETQILLDAFANSQHYAFVALSLATGMRRGETLALHWSAVDLDAKTLRVECSLDDTVKLGLRVKASAKNKSSIRTIGLDDETCAILRRQRNAQREMAMQAGVKLPPPNKALVFPNAIKQARGRGKVGDLDFTRPFKPGSISKTFARIANAAGLSGRSVHSLRHTHATELLTAGVAVHIVAARLGHSTPTITLNVYGHVIQKGVDLAVAAAANVMRGALRLQ